MHGSGKMFYSNGDVYSGNFTEGMKEGQGQLTLANDKGMYIGDFQEDEMHGNGCFQFGDGSEFVGEFYKGLQHGEGLLTTADGTEMYGEWQHGVYQNV